MSELGCEFPAYRPHTAQSFSISPEAGKDKRHFEDYFASLNFVNARDALRRWGFGVKMRAIMFIVASLLLAGCFKSEYSGSVYIVTKGHETVRLSLVPVSLVSADTMYAHFKKKSAEAKDSLSSWTAQRAALMANIQRDSSKWNDMCVELKVAWSFYRGTQYDGAEKSSWPILELLDKYGSKKLSRLDSACDLDTAIRWNSKFGREFILEGLPTAVAKTKTDVDGKYNLSAPKRKYAMVATASRMTGLSSESYYWLVWLDGKSETNLDLHNENLLSDWTARGLVTTLGEP